MTGTDAMVLGAHPDDAEIGCGGTILQLVDAGRRVVIVDATRGERGTLGTAEDRSAECAAATARLGVAGRHNLELPDTELAADAESTLRLVRVLRRERPRLLLAPLPVDVHPDHVALARLAERAFFHSGLAHYAPDAGAPFRPRLLLRYPGNDPVEPTFCVDISAVAARKIEVIRCYRSQVGLADTSHLVSGLDLLDRARVRDRFYGSRIRTEAAEPFWLDGPLPLRDLSLLI